MVRNKHILGFDYGKSRIGIAVGNPITCTARPLMTLHSGKSGIPWLRIDECIKQWGPHLLIVGLPLAPGGEETEMAREARKFGARLAAQNSIDVAYVNEYLSSRAADRIIAEGADKGKKIRQRHRSMRDSIAAALILDTYFSDNT